MDYLVSKIYHTVLVHVVQLSRIVTVDVGKYAIDRTSLSFSYQTSKKQLLAEEAVTTTPNCKEAI